MKKENYESLFNSIRDAILVADTERNIINCNPAFMEIFGYSSEEIIGKKTLSVYENEEQFLELGKALKEHFGEDPFLYTVNYKRKDDSVFPGETGVFYLKDNENNVTGFIGLIRDITDKKKAEEDLRKSEERFRNIFEDNIAPMFLLDPDNGKIVDVNPAAVKYYGWKRDEMLHMNINQINTLSPGEIKKEMENARNLSRVYFEFQHKRADGSIRDVEVFGSSIKINEKKYLHSIVHDITERKLAEAQLKKFNLNWQLLTKATQQINSVLELPIVMRQLVASARELTGAKDGTAGLLIDGKMVFKEYDQHGIVFPIDYSFVENYGVPGWVLTTRKPYISNDTENDEHVIPEIQKALGFYNLADVPILNKRGEIIGCFEMHNKPGNFDEHDVILLQNLAAGAAIAIENSQMIVQRKQAEEALRESEEKYREFFMKDLSGVFLSSVDGKMIDCNPAFLKIMGYDSLSEINLFSTFSFYKNKEDRDKILKLVRESKEVSNYESLLIKKDGSEIYVLENIVGVFDDTGNLTHLRGYIFDITSRKVAEERFQHVHSLLYAIRNVNQLIVTEKNIDKLMHRSCEILLESRGYYAMWIGLTNDLITYDKIFSFGIDKNIDTFIDQLKNRNLPPCLNGLSLNKPIIKSESIEDYCKDCIARPAREDKGVIISLIQHLDNVYGVLYIILENINLFTGEEGSLIEEVSGDLGLAIYIQQEEQRRKTAESRLQNAIDIIPDIFAVYDNEGRYIFVNKAISKYGDFNPSELIGKSPEEVLPNEIQKKSTSLLQKALENKKPQSNEISLKINSQNYWFNPRYYPILDKNNSVKEVLSISTDITERRAYEQKFIQLAEGVASKVGEEFFNVLVENLSQTLNADVVLIGKVNEDNANKIDTISVFQFGQHGENFSYDLSDTPCKNVVNKKLCSYEKDVTKLFPSDQILIDLEIEGYSGTPLWDSKGNAIGILVCLFKSPIENVKIKESIIHVFGLRAAAEMERLEHLSEIFKQRDELKESENRFRSITQTANDAIVTSDSDGIIIGWNPSAEKIFGYSAEEVLNKSLSLIIPPVYRKQHLKGMQRLAGGGEHRVIGKTIELEGLHKNGKIFPIELSLSEWESSGEKFYTGIMRDISERKHSEEEIKKLSKGVEQSSASIIITDVEGSIEYVNKKFTEITGYEQEEAIGKNPRILKSGKNEPKIYKELWTTIKSGKEWRGELCNQKKSGEFFWESESISPIVNTNGEITHFIAVKEDITEQKKLFEELTEAREKAEAADKMKSEFLAQMSHEIRSPLNAVLNFTGLIKEETRAINSETLELAFPAIESSSKRIIRTVDMILNMSDIQTGTYTISKRSFNLVDLLINLVKEYESTAQQNKLQLNFQSEIDKAEVEMDDYAVTQIFANLLDNAIKYTNKGFIEIRLNKGKGSNFIVEIEDTGIGISEEYLPDLFSPFSQEEQGYSRKFDGTGLGMSLVKKYCELINADISVKSKKDVGTIFTVKMKI
ncbi:MAG: PAS domain S-box protein [Melioribacteraceae bacterium]|nr:PAS domain S-box protein [Melioribacteraceae bacterium]